MSNSRSAASKKSLIVHIGLPKTGTSFLQGNLFGALCTEKGFLFNPWEFQRIKNRRLIYSPQEKEELHQLFAKSDVLISQEQIVDWNPRNWEEGADRALDLFGEMATIVITLRDPYDFMRSIYIQKVHEGNVVTPNNFFVSSNEYDFLSPFLPQRSLARFDYQKLDYEFLEKLYRDRFENVYFLPLTRLNSLYPWTELFNLSEEQVKHYREKFRNAPHANVAYSDLAMKMTFLREKVLRAFGIKSFGSEDLSVFNEDFFVGGKTIVKNRNISFKSLPFRKKLRKFPLRFLRTINKPWRWWMQKVLDKIISYKKYQFPADMKLFDDGLMKKNIIFLKKCEDCIKSD
jgi:hypothetical protein